METTGGLQKEVLGGVCSEPNGERSDSKTADYWTRTWGYWVRVKDPLLSTGNSFGPAITRVSLDSLQDCLNEAILSLAQRGKGAFSSGRR